MRVNRVTAIMGLTVVYLQTMGVWLWMDAEVRSQWLYNTVGFTQIVFGLILAVFALRLWVEE